jgi:two-component system sensor histidine kinase BaeS
VSDRDEGRRPPVPPDPPPGPPWPAGRPFHPGSPGPQPDFDRPGRTPAEMRRALRGRIAGGGRGGQEEKHRLQEAYRDHRDYVRWQRRHSRPRPSWWPQDEAWPPAGEFPWRKVRRTFFIRFAIGIAIFVSLIVVGPVLVISQLLAATGLTQPFTVIGAVVILIGLLIALAFLGRGGQRFAGPFGDLIEAAGRVEAGDYAARVQVPRHGWRELKGLMDAFNSMTARLEADEEQRRTLLADVSHELRTPLAVLRGELEAMIDGIHPMDEAHLAGAVDQIEMLTKLVEDLRTLALAEAGTLPIHPEPTDVAVLCADVCSSFESLAAEHAVRLELSAPDDLPLVELDPLRIRQVIGNLVANALRYAPADSAVTIDARFIGDGVEIRVTDRGPGIDPELLPHLFERFTKSEDSRGSGLGLAIARRLVEAHGGTIEATSPPTGGTEILVALPVVAHR